MNIAVFGYYNKLNAGDDRLQYCLTRLIHEGDSNSVVFLPHDQPPPLSYLKGFDWVLIGGGGLVLRRTGIWADLPNWTRRFPGRIGVLGLEILSCADGLDRDLQLLAERSEFFFVRSQESKELLNDHPQVSVGPDLTWLYPWTPPRTERRQGVAVNLVEASYLDVPASKIMEQLEPWPMKPFPMFMRRGEDTSLLQPFFDDPLPEEFTLEPLQTCELLVGCRYHAVVFAIQFGKPFIAIRNSLKVERLLADADMTDLMIAPERVEELGDRVRYVQEHRERIVGRIEEYAARQAKSARRMKSTLVEQINAWKPPARAKAGLKGWWGSP